MTAYASHAASSHAGGQPAVRSRHTGTKAISPASRKIRSTAAGMARIIGAGCGRRSPPGRSGGRRYDGRPYRRNLVTHRLRAWAAQWGPIAPLLLAELVIWVGFG